MSGIVTVPGIGDLPTLFGPGEIDCHSWLPLHLGPEDGGMAINVCTICGGTAEDHPPDAFPEDGET